MSSRVARFALPLEAEALVTDALRRGGRPPEDDGFLEPLRSLCESLDTEAALPTAARRRARALLVTWLELRASFDAGEPAAPSPDEPTWFVASLTDPWRGGAAHDGAVPVSAAPAVPPELPWGCDAGLLAAVDLLGTPIELLWHVPRWTDWYETRVAHDAAAVAWLAGRVAARVGGPVCWSPQWLGVAGALGAAPGRRTLVILPTDADRVRFADDVVALRRHWSPATPEARTRAYLSDRVDTWVTTATAAVAAGLAEAATLDELADRLPRP